MGCEYPTRCVIVDPTGHKFGTSGEYECRAPEESLPHIGKFGVAEMLNEWTVKIALDDGGVIYGSDCWWIPLPSTSKEAE